MRGWGSAPYASGDFAGRGLQPRPAKSPECSTYNQLNIN
ncbi:Uncharacterized protein dnm_090910 [Desulfonema magnum]|uniref:Uncharacterized protein n=1 Tax=Desulfonema magnum TaxID=45655 RepID=A0A975GUA9_9BACT|nr:Uncharacterized protein dnm_090910 [Desulfonema magnum]